MVTESIGVADRHARGVEIMRRMTAGDPKLSREMSEMDAICPDLSRIVVDFAFGEIYSRPGLDLRHRYFVTLASLVTLGAEAELRTHIGLALNVGLTTEEIVETILHAMVYAGFPRGVTAMGVARSVFVERGIIKPSQQ